MSGLVDIETNNMESGIALGNINSKQYSSIKQVDNDGHISAEPSYAVFQKGFTLEWSNLTYSIKTVTKEERQLLKNVSGVANSGQILSILGSSGAGKHDDNISQSYF